MSPAAGDLSLVEAARHLGITPVAARVRLHRARRSLRPLLATRKPLPCH
jgi:DNA-directed RNA polymerase specialized sigma24 family protein